MGIFDRIKKGLVSNEDRINQSHIRNFFLIAISEKISDNDFLYIEKVGDELKLSKSLIYEVFNSPMQLKILSPQTSHGLNKNIAEYVLFANRNGIITEKEKETLKVIILALTNIKVEMGNTLISKIIDIVLEEDTVDFLTHQKIGRAIGNAYLNIL